MIAGYRAVLSARFRMLLQYRAAAAAGIATQLFWGLIRMMIFEAFYRSSTVPPPMPYGDVVSYIWLGQGLLGLILWGRDTEVREMIRSGSVAYELLRPVDLYWLWLSRSLANLTAPTLLRALPILCVAGPLLGLRPPPSIAAAALFLGTIAGAALLGAALASIVTISALWTVSGEGMARIMPALVYTLSGILVPLVLLPDWMQPVVQLLPFRDMMDAPFRVYLGQIPAEEAWRVLAHQAVWIALLVAAGRALLTRGLGRLVVQGG